MHASILSIIKMQRSHLLKVRILSVLLPALVLGAGARGVCVACVVSTIASLLIKFWRFCSTRETCQAA